MNVLTIVSGKGGVGKTTLASSLAVLLAKEKKIIVVDCDVDAPNLGLSLGLKDNNFCWQDIQTSERAQLIEERCIGCGRCVDVCNFSAITFDNKRKIPVFNKFLCEGCGACQIICPANAIALKKVKNGRIGVATSPYGVKVVSGQLKMGESGSGKIVTLIKNKAIEIGEKEGSEVMIVDAAAGIGCPVIASITGSDFVVAITEPTKPALNDLKRVVSVVNHFGIKFGIVINKHGLNDPMSRKIANFANRQGAEILGRVPYEDDFVKATVNLIPAAKYNKKFEAIFHNILENIKVAMGI